MNFVYRMGYVMTRGGGGECDIVNINEASCTDGLLNNSPQTNQCHKTPPGIY